MNKPTCETLVALIPVGITGQRESLGCVGCSGA